MDPLALNIDDVIKKWEKHHHVATERLSSKDVKPWYQPMPSEAEDVMYNRRRRKPRKFGSKLNAKHQWNTEETQYVQKKFRLLPPVLKTHIQDYQLTQCKQCQDVLQFIPSDDKGSIKSQTLTLFDCITTSKRTNYTSYFTRQTPDKTSLSISHVLSRFISWCMINGLQSVFNAMCFQKKDKDYIHQLRKKSYSVLFLHGTTDLFDTILIYLQLICLDQKIPYAIIKDESVSSSFLKYLLQKMGFIFVKGTCEEKDKQTITQDILDLLKSNNNILLPSHTNDINPSTTTSSHTSDINPSTTTSSHTNDINPSTTSSSVISSILQEFRKDDTNLQHLVVVPLSLSTEKPICQTTGLTLMDLIWNYFHRGNLGLVQLNVSRAVKLKSLVKVAAGLNSQPSCDEENNLIARHMNFDILQTECILPTHLVSFMLLTKYRNGVEVTVLVDAIDDLIAELKSMDQFFGFLGDTDVITWHGVDLLLKQGVIQLDSQTSQLTVSINNWSASQQMFAHAVKIIHVLTPKAVIATSIVTCVGGQQSLCQGNGEWRTCSGDKIFEKAEFLAELVSYLLDFSCSFNSMTDILWDTLERFVTLDLLQTREQDFENQRHQKLVQNLALQSEWDEEEEESWQNTEMENRTLYKIVLDAKTKDALSFYHASVVAFIEISFIVLAVIREQLQDCHFSVADIYEIIRRRFDVGRFTFGEVVTPGFVLRVCEYLFEKEVIDDNGDMFIMSEKYSNSESLVHFLHQIAELR